MRILCYTDLHLQNIYPYNIKNAQTGLYSRVTEIYNTFEWIKNITKQEKIDLVINLGDTFHQAIRHLVERFTTTTNFINDINKSTTSGKGIVVEGNHDRDAGNNISAVEALKHSESTIVIRKSIQIKYFSEINSTFVFVPFIRDKEQQKDLFDKIYEKIKDKENVYIFGHFDIREAYEDINVEEQLEKYNTYQELNLHKFKAIFSGHLHNPKQINNNMFYIGSSVALSFSDIQANRGIVILDIDKNDCKISKIENPFSPIFVKFDIMNTEDLLEKIRYIKEEKAKYQDKNVYARFYLQNTQIARGKLEKIIEKFGSLLTFYETKFVETQDNVEEKTKEEEDLTTINIYDTIKDQVIIELKAKNFDDETIQKYLNRFEELACQ